MHRKLRDDRQTDISKQLHTATCLASIPGKFRTNTISRTHARLCAHTHTHTHTHTRTHAHTMQCQELSYEHNPEPGHLKETNKDQHKEEVLQIVLYDLCTFRDTNAGLEAARQSWCGRTCGDRGWFRRPPLRNFCSYLQVP